MKETEISDDIWRVHNNKLEARILKTEEIKKDKVTEIKELKTIVNEHKCKEPREDVVNKEYTKSIEKMSIWSKRISKIKSLSWTYPKKT